MYLNFRWKDKDGHIRHKSFIPEVERPGAGDDNDVDVDPGQKRKRQQRRATDKGAMYHDYCRKLHEWLTHLRRVHFKNPDLTVNGRVLKATNPLAPPGQALYYLHSRTAYYNSFFFEYWNHAFAKTFRQLCPFYTIRSVKDLDQLLAATIQRYSVTTHYYVLLHIGAYWSYSFRAGLMEVICS